MKKIIRFILIILPFQVVLCQNTDDFFTVMFYNVENLFDITDQPGKDDEEFTPGSEKQWNNDRYEKKLENIARVISSVNKNELPEIVGLCEVENQQVLADLVKKRDLRKGKYQFIHEEGPDVRGIDVALLYRGEHFHVDQHKTIPVIFPFDSTETTRDILFVQGMADNGESFYLFINHWSSRSGGIKETEPKRIYSAIALRKEIDAVLNRDPDAKIIIMGDFNDEPTNRSVYEMLIANNKRKNASSRELYNLMYDSHNINNQGTYNYKGTWNMLDQIIISRSLLNTRAGYHLNYEAGRIFREEWMLYKNESLQDYVPSRTYSGNDYYGGFSDHLPVYVNLKKPD